MIRNTRPARVSNSRGCPKRPGPQGQEGFRYLAELDRKEYRRMSVEQKLRIMDELHQLAWFLSPHVQFTPALEETLKQARRIKRIMQHAAS